MTSESVVMACEPESPAPSPPIGTQAGGAIFAATFGCFLSVTPAVVTVLGVFLKPIAAEFGWPRSEVAGALSVLALGNAVVYPFAGRLADRIGPRRTVLIGNVLLGISILLLTQVPAQPAIYYLLFLLTGAAGALPSTMVFAKFLAEWFDRTRGFWMGFAGGVGNGLGATFFPMIAAWLLISHGWRTGYLGVGAAELALGFPVLFLLLREAPIRRHRAAAGAAEAIPLTGMTFREAIRSARFWWIFSILPVGAGCMTAMFSTIVPILTDRGLALTGATAVTAAFALTTLVVEPAIGWLIDRSSSPRIVAPLYLTTVCGLWLLLHAQSQILLLLAGMLIGVGAGVEYCAMPYLLSRYFGLKELGAISGIAYSGTLLFGALAPLFLNSVYDLLGRYDVAVYTIAAILLYSSAAMLTFGPYRFAIHHHG